MQKWARIQMLHLMIVKSILKVKNNYHSNLKESIGSNLEAL